MDLALDGDAIRTGGGTGAASAVAAAHPRAMGSHAGVSEELTGMKWQDALRTPAFWIFALASSTYGLVWSGISLFNESILTERGFDYYTFYNSLIIVAMTGLLGNFIGGWLTDRWRMNRLMAVTMFLLMIALIALPMVQTVATYGVRHGDGSGGRLRHGVVLRLLEPSLRPPRAGPHPGLGAGHDRLRLRRRPAAARVQQRRHGLLRRLLLRHRHPRRPPRLRLLGGLGTDASGKTY